MKACLLNHFHFCPYFVSVDGLLGVEEEAMLKLIVSRFTTKWKPPYSSMCGYVNSRMVISVDINGIPLRYHRDDIVVVFRYY